MPRIHVLAVLGLENEEDDFVGGMAMVNNNELFSISERLNSEITFLVLI